VFTVRNLGGAALFLFGTTSVWLTPAFAIRGAWTKGAMWSVTQVLALATLAGFTIATWGLFPRASWWEGVGSASAVLGLAVFIPYWLAAHHAGEPTPWFNVLIHALGDVAY
jgi:hypothetical protein